MNTTLLAVDKAITELREEIKCGNDFPLLRTTLSNLLELANKLPARPRYSIQYKDLGISVRDAGPFRCYELNTEGDTLAQLKLNATISEIDQDGGELRCYGLEDCDSAEVLAAVERILAKVTA